MTIVRCKQCKRKKEHYAKGMCGTCYRNQYDTKEARKRTNDNRQARFLAELKRVFGITDEDATIVFQLQLEIFFSQAQEEWPKIFDKIKAEDGEEFAKMVFFGKEKKLAELRVINDKLKVEEDAAKLLEETCQQSGSKSHSVYGINLNLPWQWSAFESGPVMVTLGKKPDMQTDIKVPGRAFYIHTPDRIYAIVIQAENVVKGPPIDWKSNKTVTDLPMYLPEGFHVFGLLYVDGNSEFRRRRCFKLAPTVDDMVEMIRDDIRYRQELNERGVKPSKLLVNWRPNPIKIILETGEQV